MRFEDVIFLDADSVEEAHDEELSLSGGTRGLRDRGLLESAVAGPEWEEIIVRVATGTCSRDELADLIENAMGADVDVVVG